MHGHGERGVRFRGLLSQLSRRRINGNRQALITYD
jgi:hypothetical protein